MTMRNALSIAFNDRDIPVIKAIILMDDLEKDNINLPDETAANRGPLIRALFKDKLPNVAHWLLTEPRVKDKLKVNAIDKFGYSALMLTCVYTSDIIIMKLLLAREEIDINIIAHDKITALMLAITTSQLDKVDEILTRSDLNIESINAQTQEKKPFTALHCAIQKNYKIQVIHLLKLGADFNHHYINEAAADKPNILKLIKTFTDYKALGDLATIPPNQFGEKARLEQEILDYYTEVKNYYAQKKFAAEVKKWQIEIFQWRIKLAETLEAGNLPETIGEARWYLADCYFEGKENPRDYLEAVKWYARCFELYSYEFKRKHINRIESIADLDQEQEQKHKEQPIITNYKEGIAYARTVLPQLYSKLISKIKEPNLELICAAISAYEKLTLRPGSDDQLRLIRLLKQRIELIRETYPEKANADITRLLEWKVPEAHFERVKIEVIMKKYDDALAHYPEVVSQILLSPTLDYELALDLCVRLKNLRMLLGGSKFFIEKIDNIIQEQIKPFCLTRLGDDLVRFTQFNNLNFFNNDQEFQQIGLKLTTAAEEKATNAKNDQRKMEFQKQINLLLANGNPDKFIELIKLTHSISLRHELQKGINDWIMLHFTVLNPFFQTFIHLLAEQENQEQPFADNVAAITDNIAAEEKDPLTASQHLFDLYDYYLEKVDLNKVPNRWHAYEQGRIDAVKTLLAQYKDKHKQVNTHTLKEQKKDMKLVDTVVGRLSKRTKTDKNPILIALICKNKNAQHVLEYVQENYLIANYYQAELCSNLHQSSPKEGRQRALVYYAKFLVAIAGIDNKSLAERYLLPESEVKQMRGLATAFISDAVFSHDKEFTLAHKSLARFLYAFIFCVDGVVIDEQIVDATIMAAMDSWNAIYEVKKALIDHCLAPEVFVNSDMPKVKKRYQTACKKVLGLWTGSWLHQLKTTGVDEILVTLLTPPTMPVKNSTQQVTQSMRVITLPIATAPGLDQQESEFKSSLFYPSISQRSLSSASFKYSSEYPLPIESYSAEEIREGEMPQPFPRG
ncbi:MAG: ankyrin repeat domain-containing protein [Gammaproteobacteria bacterium]